MYAKVRWIANLKPMTLLKEVEVQSQQQKDNNLGLKGTWVHLAILSDTMIL